MTENRLTSPDPGISQINESHDQPLETTTDMLAVLAEKFRIMKTLHSMVNDLFALDQQSCVEFLEKMLKELKKTQNIQPSVSSSVTTLKAGLNQNTVKIENRNTATIENLNNPVQEALPSIATRNESLSEDQLHVDENLNKKVWSLANRISDSVTRALNLDEAQTTLLKKKKTPPRKCYYCRLSGHFIADCPGKRNEMSLPGDSFQDEYLSVRKSRYGRFEEDMFEERQCNSQEFNRSRFRSRSTYDPSSEISESGYFPPSRKSKVRHWPAKMKRICFICRLPGHEASMCAGNRGLKPPGFSQSHLPRTDTYKRRIT